MTDPTALPNFPPPPDEHPLRGRVLDVVKDLGINPDIDADGDVAFTVGEPAQQLFVRCQDGDYPIMRVFGQWLVGDQVPADELERLRRCNEFTLQLNLAKVGLSGDNLVVTAEHLVGPDSDLTTLVQVTVDLILQVVGAWHQSFVPDGGESAGAPDAEGDR